MLQTPSEREKTQSSVALTVRLRDRDEVGTHAFCMLKKARLSSSIAPLKARPSENAARQDATTVVSCRREVAVLVEQAHDRRRERGADGGAGEQQERDLAQARADERAEPRPVARGRAPRERREQHGGHRDREHALRQHVDAERLVDGGRAEVLVDARREPRVDEQVEVDQPEAERDRQHQREDALHGLVARVAEPLQVPEAPHRGVRDRELDDRAEQDAERVRVEARVGRVQERQAERERADDHEVPGHRRDGGQEELVERVQDRASGGRSGRASRRSGR